ncbi:hypothetical protein E6C67_31045 [Azospirillum sp. TSA2s]|uniref:hypothetical protein n=1 Tax=Azospirillum sp. TSA2s TaxID=709810 RepID=UPI0010AA3F49|nr:hypothetical protein [Azospirillum sp. TSA2s]QCG98129.1 hypothetical protein E6C67_31045 [Azospirillum sp. TSA2s]
MTDVTDSHDDLTIEIDRLDALLPCRRFHIQFKVAAESTLSLTTEFLLRLLRHTDDLTDQDIAEFFGFNEREVAYVLEGAEGFINRKRDRISLNAAGDQRFDLDPSRPRLINVAEREILQGFELISFNPVKVERISSFARGLPELPIVDAEAIENSDQKVKEAFRRRFSDIKAMRAWRNETDETLYSIDSLTGSDRRDVIVPISVRLPENGGEVVPNLEGWTSGPSSQDTLDIVSACATLLQASAVPKVPETAPAYDLMVDCMQGQLASFRTPAGFDRRAFFDRVKGRKGVFRKERLTLPVIGSLCAEENQRRLREAIRLAGQFYRKAKEGPDLLLWWKPDLPHWGCSSHLPVTVELLQAGFVRQGDLNKTANNKADAKSTGPGIQSIGPGVVDEPEDDERLLKPVLFTRYRPRLARQFGEVFEAILTHDGPSTIQPTFELLLVPSRLVAILVHAPMSGNGYPIPMGAISVDPAVVERAHGLMQRLLTNRLTVARPEGDRSTDWAAIVRDAVGVTQEPGTLDDIEDEEMRQGEGARET